MSGILTGMLRANITDLEAAQPAHSTIKSTIKLNAPLRPPDGTKWTHKFNLDDKYNRQIRTEFYATNQHQHTRRTRLIKEDTTMEAHCQASLRLMLSSGLNPLAETPCKCFPHYP
ncbi:hypothetical protein GE21DRAFT_1342261 [Neurospora crassa]|nr:hypothetical protein GE21DRAFT_1342261 [Neurospora crassa]